jgi:TatD DNase family protein
LDRFRRPPDVLARALDAGVRVIAVTLRPSDFRVLFPLYGRRNGVRLALGLHPLEVAKVDLAGELSLFESYSSHTSYVGEVGLDFSSEGKPMRALQEQALDAILATPGVAAKVMSVHSRAASAATIERLQAAKATRVILHWFSGSLSELDSGLEAGFYVSVNPAMTRSEKGRAIIGRLPRDRVLIESDGPFARVAGRPLEPSDVSIAAEYLGEVWGESPHDVSGTLAMNLRRLCDGL